MGTPQKLKLDKIVDIFEAIKMVEENTKIDFPVSYRLGRLSERCRSIIKVFEKTQNRLRTEYSEKINAVNKDKDSKSEDEKKAIDTQVRELNDSFISKINELVEVEETIEVPEFKLKEFENKEIPVKFFALMGDLIQE